MLSYNYHTHTYRCGHAIGQDEDYVKAAIKTGYKTLGFSDHAPYREYPLKGTHMEWDQLDEYISSINTLKEKYKGIIDIKCGLETEYIEGFLEEKQYLRSKTDYLILGQHYIDPRGCGNFFGLCSDEHIMEYAHSVCNAMDTGLFTYMCHPDMFMHKQPGFNDACREASKMIVKKAVETDTPLEINIHGVLRGRYEFSNGYLYHYPHKDFWKIAGEYGAKCVVGIDAHDPNELLNEKAFQDGMDELSDLHLNIIDRVDLK